MLGNSVAAVAVPLVAVVTLRESTFTVGLLTAAARLPWLLVGPPAGARVDRLPKRPVTLVCNAVSAVVFASVPIAAWLGALTVTHLLVVAAAGGVARVFFGLACRAYLPILVEDGRLPEADTELQAASRPRRSPARGSPGCSRRRSAR